MTICTIVQTTSRGFAILDIELTRNNDFYNGQKSREWLRPDSSEKSFFETCFRSLNYFVSKSAIRYREKKNDTIKIGRDFYAMQSIVTISIVLDFFLRTSSLSLFRNQYRIRCSLNRR